MEISVISAIPKLSGNWFLKMFATVQFYVANKSVYFLLVDILLCLPNDCAQKRCLNNGPKAV